MSTIKNDIAPPIKRHEHQALELGMRLLHDHEFDRRQLRSASPARLRRSGPRVDDRLESLPMESPFVLQSHRPL